ncbi:MAG TPA: hypothetical protein PKA28_13420 [Methylomusa anaerophila]|uniref:hypothetical protein n=1 Tax=Methylomusa anaerophila TaxID=1930071 RepID=UPI000F8478CF|nr:hypothetical protein [Methylomusa anaerophila]HML89435.1 hypothetical protein [Methylomusa anaerophila]
MPTESSRWIYECYQKKIGYAKSVSQPKIVWIAGSSGLFGVNMAEIGDRFNVPTLNFGVHAGLRLKYIVDMAKTVLVPEDTAIVAMEYELFLTEKIPNVELLDYMFSRDPDYLHSQNIMNQAKFYFALSEKRLLAGLKAKRQPQTASLDGYQASTLNRHGDETKKYLDPQNTPLINIHNRVLSETPNWSALLKGIPDDSPQWTIFRDFLQWCKSNHVRVILTYPSVAYFPEYQGEIGKKTLSKVEQFYNSLETPVLGTPTEFMYDKKYFYDTIYHLNSEGAKLHTQELITMLQPYLQRP